MAKRKQKIFSPASSDAPAISVIIPLYNVEKYVAECLDSLLAQTFQNFEVIVVDDCSTDKSVKIVQSYMSKFGGRLSLKHTEKNSGCGAVPRNVGVPFACGEYVSFLDADDTITPTAFEELYGIAKDFDADVVSCEKYFLVPERRWYDKKWRKQLKPVNWREGEFVTAPTLLTDNIAERAKSFHQKQFNHNVWSKLFRRKLILETKLNMPNIPGEDVVFTICALCVAERYVLVPNVVNHYRIREDSVTTEKISDDKLFHKWLRALRIGFKHLDEFLSVVDVDTKFIFLDAFAQEMFYYFAFIYEQFSITATDKIVREEFSDGDNLALTAFVFSAMNTYRLQLSEGRQQLEKFNDLSAQIQQRLDDMEKINRQDKAYISELENFIAGSQQHIAELEDEIRRLNDKE